MKTSKNIKANYIALSFDIEDWYHGALGISLIEKPDIEKFLSENNRCRYDLITDETLRIIKILNEFHIKATFFVVADVALKYPEITNALKSSDHEIASHSYTHTAAIESNRKITDKPSDEWYQEQKKAKKVLEDVFEREIIGFRAPSAYFANWMVPMLVDLGFKYDSSIAYNSFYNKTNVKLRDIPSKPYRLNSQTLSNIEPDSDLIELPWSNYKVCNKLILPAGGAFFFRALGYRYFKMILNRSVKKGDTMFYLHPNEISRKPVPMYSKSLRPFYWINKGKKTERNLIKLLKAYQHLYRPCCDVYYKNLNEKTL